jgi:N-acetylneuraminate synthase
MKAGERISHENVRAIRPGLGLPPKYLGLVRGMKVVRDVSRGTALSFDLLS